MKKKENVTIKTGIMEKPKAPTVIASIKEPPLNRAVKNPFTAAIAIRVKNRTNSKASTFAKKRETLFMGKLQKWTSTIRKRSESLALNFSICNQKETIS
jgi:hypothetical protein